MVQSEIMAFSTSGSTSMMCKPSSPPFSNFDYFEQSFFGTVAVNERRNDNLILFSSDWLNPSRPAGWW